MLFLGTAAADVIPNPFCSCPICQDARQYPERGRLRSHFLLDNETLIDFGPDLAAAAMHQQMDLSALRRVFVTHTYEDHLSASNAGLVSMSMTHDVGPLDVYLSEIAYEQTMELFEKLADSSRYAETIKELSSHDVISLHPIPIGLPQNIGNYKVMAVRATHRVSEKESAVNYRFERADGMRLLYACDTGLYTPETIEMLEGSKVDILIMEATWGDRTDIDLRSHLSGPGYLKMLELMLQAEIIRPDTRCFATHINHKHSLNHVAFQAWFDQRSQIPVIVAHDGLRITL